MYPSVIVRVSCGLLARKESDSDALDAKPRRCYRAGTDARTRTHAHGTKRERTARSGSLVRRELGVRTKHYYNQRDGSRQSPAHR